MDHVTASPLCWPQGWKRSISKESSRFGKWNKPVSIAKATDFVLEELRRMGIPDYNVIISTDLKLRNDGLPYSSQRDPNDKGCSVWWKDGSKQMVLALDKYDRIADNLYAIGKTVEAMRGIERWGSGEILERTFTGFQALPDPSNATVEGWRQILDYYGNDIKEANSAYKVARKKAHPDHGGSSDQFYKVNEAWAKAEAELSS